MKTKIKRALSTISPEFTTRLMYAYNFRKWLNLKDPKTFNEKLQYLKLRTYYNNPVITQCVDKYRVRQYLEEKGYGWMLPDLLGGAYEDPEDIRKDWETFPDKIAIKCNHGCKFNILVADKASMDIDEVVEQLKVWIKDDFWKTYCEPQYKDVPKRVIVEEYLGDDLTSYKFYCLNGNPEALYVSTNGKIEYLDFMDLNWNRLPITLDKYPHADHVEKPKNFEKMVEVAKDLSKDFPFVRVDLYNVDGNIYFSELTFLPTGGNMKLDPPSVLEDWGRKLKV